MRISLRTSFKNLAIASLKQLVFLTGWLLFSWSSFAQLTVDTSATAEQLANSIIDPSYNISNVKLTCAKTACAKFANASAIGFEKGILLTTGSAALAKGPNNNLRASWNNGTPGDIQLDTLYGFETYDGCALEFDFIPTCDKIKIRYVFGSEEYPDYLNSNFTDIIGFYISGPGIKSSKNIALNWKDGGNDYFIDNKNGTAIQYNGYTKPMTALQTVTPSGTYHLKLVIADVLDGSFDSGVFIEEGSLQCGTVGINTPALNAGVQIYPNPADEVMYVQAPVVNRTINLSIYSVVGKVVYQENYVATTQPHHIDTGSIEANGIYFVKIQSGNETITRKITINH